MITTSRWIAVVLLIALVPSHARAGAGTAPATDFDPRGASAVQDRVFGPSALTQVSFPPPRSTLQPRDRWIPRPEPRPRTPRRVARTGAAAPTPGAALAVSLAATAIPCVIGAALMHDENQDALRLRAAFGEGLVLTGATFGPSAGYVYGRLHGRAAASAAIRVAALYGTFAGESNRHRDLAPVAWTLFAGSMLWDFARVAPDVERGSDWGFGLRPRRAPDGTTVLLLVATARF